MHRKKNEQGAFGIFANETMVVNLAWVKGRDGGTTEPTPPGSPRPKGPPPID